jgi:PEP-CTERM motif
VNTSGIIGNDSSNDPLNGGLTLANANGLLTNAGNIGYLLLTYGSSAASTAQQEGLQAAIWQEVYGSNFTTTLTGDALTDYTSYISSVPAGGNAADISQVYWINPSGNGSGIQGLVGNVIPINPDFSAPEPASLTLLGTGLLACGGFGVRRRRREAA